MELMNGILNCYSEYSGTGIFTVLFFVALIYVALIDKNRSNRTVLLYGSVILIIIIFFPATYYFYTKYVDAGTYWRFFWLMPVGVGLSYVATKLADENKITGLLMIAIIFVLGGTYVYSSRADYIKAKNAYQIPQEVIEIADYLESRELEEIRCAVTPELLTYMRQYDVNIIMPYGREQLDPKWSAPSGFFELMLSGNINYEAIGEKCLYNNTRFIVVNNQKLALNDPGRCGFEFIMTTGPFDLYEYVGTDEN